MHRWFHKRAIPFLALALVMTVGSTAEIRAESLSFTLDAPYSRRLEAQAIAKQLGDMGVNVNLKMWNKNDLRAEIAKGERVAYLTDWGSAYFDPYDLAEPKLSIGGRGNFSFYSNDRLDALLQFCTFSEDNRIRRDIYHQVQDIIYKQTPWVFGYVLHNVAAASNSVVNFYPSMDDRINLHDVGLNQGDTIVVGLNQKDFLSLDPAMHRNRVIETVIRNIFDGLVTRTHKSEVVPELAESWRKVDNVTYIFTLREGLLFHNGDPVTAEDVAFTFSRVLSPNAVGGYSSPRKDLLGPLEKVEAIDARQVRFILKKPFPLFLQALVHFQVVPKKYIQEVGDKKFGEEPVGAGPFKFVQNRYGGEVVLERFDAYYGGSPDLPPVGPARVRRAVFKAMPDTVTRSEALFSGEVSIIQDVPIEYIERIKNSESLQVLFSEGTRSYQIELNNKKPPFNDIRVRKALNFAINWNVILSDIYKDHGRRLATCFLPSGFGYNPELKPHPYDPAKAKVLLESAGYETGTEKE